MIQDSDILQIEHIFNNIIAMFENEAKNHEFVGSLRQIMVIL